jgi:hypothetical protein
MTAVAIPRRTSAARTHRAGRLLRLELRRSPMVWVVPLIMAMFWFDTFRSSMALPALWGSRTLLLRQGTALTDFAPFVAGAAAWTAARDGRRGTADQVAVTALPRWAARVTTWAATTCWALVTFAGCVAALYAMTASQGAAGEPPWWPVAVSAAGVAAFGALGFAAGVWYPSRFAAPLAAVAALLTLIVIRQVGGVYMLISPIRSPEFAGTAMPEDGAFHPYLADLSIVQLLFLAGLVILALGTLGLPSVAGEVRLRVTAAVVTAAGLAVAGTAVALVGTAHITAGGVAIPAIHNAADDRSYSAPPACTGSTVPVCVNPTYKTYLPVLAGALTPVLDEVAGLPGAPVRTTQVEFASRYPGLSIANISGHPLVLNLALNFGYRGSFASWYGSGPLPASLTPASSDRLWSNLSLVREEALPPIAVTIITNVTGRTGQAQRAVAMALLMATGVPPSALSSSLPTPGAPALPKPSAPVTAPVTAAATRFAALPAAARHAWLAIHLAALRAGHVTPAEVP